MGNLYGQWCSRIQATPFVHKSEYQQLRSMCYSDTLFLGLHRIAVISLSIPLYALCIQPVIFPACLVDLNRSVILTSFSAFSIEPSGSLSVKVVTEPNLVSLSGHPC